MNLLRETVVGEARSWLGTPFKHQACVRGCGVGCGTFLIAVYSSVGIKTPAIDSLPFFTEQWHLHEREERYLAILEQFARYVESPVAGDIAVFKMGRVYSHSAIVIDWPTVIHAHWKGGVEIADASKPPLKDRPIRFMTPF